MTNGCLTATVATIKHQLYGRFKCIISTLHFELTIVQQILYLQLPLYTAS